jgi:hypothetical protein
MIAIHAIGKRQPQGPMSPMEVMVEKLQAHQRIERGIPLGESVCLAGEGIEPIAQRPVEPFDMHGTSWLHLCAQHGTDLHRQEAPMLIAMLDGLRQGQRLWDDQPGTPPLARSHGLSIGPYQDALVAMPAITEPAERALVGPLDGAAHRLLKQVLTEAGRWRRRLRSDCPGLGPGSPSVLLRPAGKLRPFFLHERPEFIDFHLA